MSTTYARAWAIRRRDGLVLGMTDHDQPLAFEGIEFRPDTGMSARAIVQGAGLSVDNTEAEGALASDAITEADLIAGRWDGAELRLWQVDWAAPDNRSLLFRGHLGEVARSGGAFRAELRGLSEGLGGARGRVFHPRCGAHLGDGQCRADLTGEQFTADLVVDVCDEGRVFRFARFPAYERAWFERGVLRITSGPAAGLSGAIKDDRALDGGGREVVLWQGLGAMPAPGDGVRLVAGCDKRAGTCRAKFGNWLNFRGFPHLPPEDWLIAPQVGGRHG